MVKPKMLHLLCLFFLLQALFVQGGLTDEFGDLEGHVRSFLNGTEDRVLILEGTYATTAEKLAYAYLKETQPQVAGKEIIPEAVYPTLSYQAPLLILIGGPKQNAISKSLLENPNLRAEHQELSTAVVDYVYEGDTKKAIIFSDKAGYYNEPRTSAQKSPLAKFIPVKYVPAAATGIAFFFLWFWEFFLKFGHKIIRVFASGKVMKWIKKKEFKKHFKGHHLKGIRIKWREWFAIFAAASVFALAIAYTFLAPEAPVWSFVLLNVISNAVIYGVRNFTRLVFDKIHGHHTEYVFWWWGGLITLLSGWLGNTFSLAGYVISEDESNKKTEGKVNWWINMITFVVFLVFFVWNMLAPATLIQMIMILAISLGFIQMLPLHPFSGKSIYAWKKGVWWVTFLPMLAFYILTNIII